MENIAHVLIYLVDDEVLIAESLAHLLRTHFQERAEVICFTDAARLIEAFEAKPCNLLLSDIRMPGMTGLEMLRRLRETGVDFEAVFLTGYDMFEYAYASIRENACGYLLKNEPDERVLETVDKAVERILRKRAFVRDLEQSRRDLAALREQMTRQALRDLLSGGVTDASLEQLADRRIYMLLGFIAENGEDETENALALRAVADGLRRAPQLRMDWQEQFTLHRDLIWLFSSVEALDRNAFYQVLCELQELVSAYVSGALLLVTDYETAPVSESYERYQRLKRVKMDHLLMGVSGIAGTAQEEAVLPREDAIALRETQRLPSQIFVLLENGMPPSRILPLVEALCFFWEHHSAACEMPATQLYMKFCADLLSFIQENDLAASFPMQEMDELLHVHLPIRFREKTGRIRGVMERLLAARSENERSRLNRISDQVRRYVTEHLEEDLSTGAIAAKAGYSEAHLSRIFKENTGETLHQYIQRMRIENACRLLRDTHEKIYWIAQKCGYASTAYFIRVFRNERGVTPQEFRDGQAPLS